MPADTHQADVVFVDINIDFANCLGSICVEEDSFFLAKLADSLDILNDTYLVVDVYDANT